VEGAIELVEVEREIEIAASPETVWRFLSDPQLAQRWWGTRVDLDLVPGGGYRVEVVPGRVVSGAFVEIDPPRRLVYTFGWEAGSGVPGSFPPGSTRVEIDLQPEGGGTRLRLVHRELPGTESAAAHGDGWSHYLGRLALAASGRGPGPDPWAQSAA
jgi:uncharacterized protein YndB with AHSA1/START domain